MKKLLLVIILLGLMIAGSTQAGVYSFRPNPTNLYNLDHNRAYTWGINWTHRNERITEAVLTFHNIWNWRHEPNNLYTHLLNNPSSGVRTSYDFLGNGDFFANQGYLVGNWTDPRGGRPSNFDLTYRFSSLGLIDALNRYAYDGRFGFGFDPDCHYYNTGITLEITTGENKPPQPPQTTVPEPATLVLFGLGLVGAGIVRRVKK